MEKNKKVITLAALTGAMSIGLLVAFGLQMNPNKTHISDADGVHYDLAIAAPGEKTVTANGNEIAIEQNGYSPTTGYWGSLASEGYFGNTTPLHGLESITVTFSADVTLAVSYGWEDAPLAAQGTVTLSEPTFDFNGESPTFFRVINTTEADVPLLSVNLRYTCQGSETPEDYLFTYAYNGAGYTVTKYVSKSPTAVIPSTHLGEPVTAIGAQAFYNCPHLVSVTIPDTVTLIDTEAFWDCTSLVYAPIPSSVITLGDWAFQNCRSLTELNLPSSVTAIGEGAFTACHSLESIVVDALNPVFDSRNDCNAIIETATKTLVAGCQNTFIPNTVEHIGDWALYGFSKPTITIPSSVASIGSYAFYESYGLTSITIPSSVASIGNYVFPYCSALTSISVEAGNPAYDSREGCNAIIQTAKNALIAGCANTVIPSSVTSIGDYAFSGRSALTSITIPSSVTSIGTAAFDSCESLASISLPASITEIPVAAFNKCYSLESVEILGEVTSIGAYAFQVCQSLTSFEVPASVKVLGNNVFNGCTSLSSITLHEGLESYGMGVFRYCAISSLTIPNSVTSMGTYTFSLCPNLTSATLPAGITKLPTGTFYGCSSLTSYEIPSSVTVIEDEAFAYSGLESIVIPEDCYLLCDRSFVGCTDLLSVTLPASMQAIGLYAFAQCPALPSIVIPAAVNYIGEGAFAGCGGLTIRCEAASQPAGWDEYWNAENRPVVWDYHPS